MNNRRCFAVKFSNGQYLTQFDGDWGVTSDAIYARLFANPSNALTACKMANNPANGFNQWYSNLLPAVVTTINLVEVNNEGGITV